MAKKPYAILGFVIVLALGTVSVVELTARTMASVASCAITKTNHMLVIRDGVVAPASITGEACDTMTIKNTDRQTRKIGFGNHDEHMTYDGKTQQILRKGDVLTVTLSQAGSYTFHDHYDHKTLGEFIVK